jgi:uncharacterized protein YcbK (DUF882 family)
MFNILTEIVEQDPEIVGFLSELLNSAWAWVMSLGTAGAIFVTGLMRSVLPSKTALVTLTDRINEVKQLATQELHKLEELEIAQKEYEETNDELLMELANLSPNKRAKELGDKLREKKEKLSIQKQIQDKVNQAVKSVESKAVSILKKKD